MSIRGETYDHWSYECWGHDVRESPDDGYNAPYPDRRHGSQFVQVMIRAYDGRVVRLPVWHLDALPWDCAPIPRRWHRHWAQTVEEFTRRCTCGAWCIGEPGAWNSTDWRGRNSRRRSRPTDTEVPPCR